jgi:hypothetical protein
MAAHARTPPTGLSPDWIARSLVSRRDRLVVAVPRRVALARRLTRDQHEWIVDDAIDFLVTQFPKPLPGPDDVERAFWKAVNIRVRQVYDGRHETVRAGWKRVRVEDLELPDDVETPEETAIRRFELATLREFEAVLSPDERTVLALKHSGPRERGRFEIAKVLGRRPFEVRRAERAITRKLKEFAAIVAAGRLCDERHTALEAVASGQASDHEHQLAHAHLAHCLPCRAEYKALVRAAHTGQLQRELGQFLPAPTIEITRQRRGPWEVVIDWLSRPFGHDATISVSQLAPAGRGLSTLAGAKLLSLCLGGAAAVGGGFFCVEQITDRPSPRPQVALHAKPHRHIDPKDDRARPVPSAVAATPTPARTATSSRTSSTKKAKGGEISGGPSSHEKAASISPPVTTSSGDPVNEFGPGPSSTAPRRPAAAPVNGGPEFP